MNGRFRKEINMKWIITLTNYDGNKMYVDSREIAMIYQARIGEQDWTHISLKRCNQVMAVMESADQVLYKMVEAEKP